MTKEEKIEEIRQRARKNFSLGYNCAECVTEAVLSSGGYGTASGGQESRNRVWRRHRAFRRHLRRPGRGRNGRERRSRQGKRSLKGRIKRTWR